MDYKILSILRSVYNHTNSGVSYAETKNAVLIGFNVALLGMAASLGKGAKGPLLIVLIVFIVLLSAAAGISLFSFWPFTGQDNNMKVTDDSVISDTEKESAVNENLLFYGAAAGKRPVDYIQCLYYRYKANDKIKPSEMDSLTVDYAREIVYNGRIAMRKYNFFKYALLVEACAGGAGVCLLILMLVLG